MYLHIYLMIETILFTLEAKQLYNPILYSIIIKNIFIQEICLRSTYNMRKATKILHDIHTDNQSEGNQSISNTLDNL